MLHAYDGAFHASVATAPEMAMGVWPGIARSSLRLSGIGLCIPSRLLRDGYCMLLRAPDGVPIHV